MTHSNFFKQNKESSMSYWWPKIKDLDIPQPNTIRVPIDNSNLVNVIDGREEIQNIAEMRQACKDIGSPTFIRNNVMSAKHGWESTCHLTNPADLERHIAEITEATLMACMGGELVIDAMFFREFLQLETTGFTAFHGKMPINKEVRCFIHDGKIDCVHPYWFNEVFDREVASEVRMHKMMSDYKVDSKKGHGQLPADWSDKLAKSNELTFDDEWDINVHLDKVRPHFKDYWSVDFTKDVYGTWNLIDMARGELSQHHPECTHNKP